jgi:hypothetical protein
MGYSTRQEFEQALANVLTTASPVADAIDNTIPITSIGNTLYSTISEEEVRQYIRWADENLDAWLRDNYRTPLRRVNRGCYPLAVDITAGDEFLYLADTTRFNPGDLVLIRDSSVSQEMTIETVPSQTRMNFTAPVTSSYLAADTNAERIRYPDPIPKTSARLAAAYFFDKYFASQQEPNQSEYGKYLRTLAFNDINLITSGKIRLDVPDAGEYIGRRYYNLVLEDVPFSKAEPGKEWLKGGV